jgi:hypothetical protein
MKTSESIKELASALAKAQGAFDHAKKDVKNEFFKSKYADLASVIDAAKKPLSDNGLSVCQICETTESGDIRLETILMHSSGEFISGSYPIRPVKGDPQAYGSAITYARRYAFSAITGIAADDDDGNQASQAAPYKAPPKSTEPKQDIIDYAALLSGANSLDDLVKSWAMIPKARQAEFVDLKNEVKEKLLKPM